MKVFAVEYLSAGGLYDGEFPPTAASEGLAMLTAALRDLAAIPGLEVATMLAERLPPTALPGRVHPVRTGDLLRTFRQLVAWADAVLVIAPETGGVLADLSHEVERAGRLLLGSSPEGVALAGDKLLTAELLRTRHVPTPAVAPLGADPVLPAGWRFPLVVKPRDGCSSDGVRLVRRNSQLPRRQAGAWLVQQYVRGEAMSVSLLVARGKAVALSLNSQEMQLRGGGFQYRGGRTAVLHPLQSYACEIARAAALAIPGLCGYVGVDLVLTAREPVVIEVNPRFTSAYTGLQAGCSINLMGAVIAACRDGVLPAEPITVSTVAYSLTGPVKEEALW